MKATFIRDCRHFFLKGAKGMPKPYVHFTADELRERQRFTDDKGHYHPEWRAGINTPPGR